MQAGPTTACSLASASASLVHRPFEPEQAHRLRQWYFYGALLLNKDAAGALSMGKQVAGVN